MPLSWNEIKNTYRSFYRRKWKDEVSEDAEAKSFWMTSKEPAAQNVAGVKAKFLESSLADLYDPNTMPPELVKAHQALDKAVDLCYRPQPFINETKRIEFCLSCMIS